MQLTLSWGGNVAARSVIVPCSSCSHIGITQKMKQKAGRIGGEAEQSERDDASREKESGSLRRAREGKLIENEKLITYYPLDS